MNYEANSFDKAPIFNQFQRVYHMKNKGDEGYYSETTESKADEEYVKKNMSRSLKC